MRDRYKKHPLLSQFSSSLPGDIKEMFKWMEFIVFNSPVAAAGVKKLSESPITSFKYITSGDVKEGSFSEAGSWKDIIENKLKLKPELLSVAYNTLVYGNQFISVYTPYIRMTVCESCQHMEPIENSIKLKVKLRKQVSDNYVENEKNTTETQDLSEMYKDKKKHNSNLIFTKYCKKEHKVTSHTIVDIPTKSVNGINIIQWNPYNIDIFKNKISGKSTYYYRAESSIVSGVEHSDPMILNAIPLSMIEAVLAKKVFKFSEGHIYHMRRDTLSGVSNAWGLPILASAIPSFLNAMVLRKANEKIASDYMVPLRVAYPSQTQSPDSIYNYISGSDFVGKLNKIIASWKLDPSGVQTAPFPIEVQSILGDGKMLTVYQELEASEVSIASSLGIPIEFIKGGLSYNAQGASLRLLENQMAKLTSSLNGFIEFVVGKIAKHLDKVPITIELLPFKIIDDLQEKATIVQLAAQNSGISRETLMEIFNMDAEVERNQLIREQKDDIKTNLEIQKYQQDVQQSIEEKARAEEAQNNSSFQNLDQQMLLQEADTQVQQLMQMQDGQRRSALDEMAKTNYILYATVKARIDMAQQKQGYQAKQQVKGQQQ